MPFEETTMYKDLSQAVTSAHQFNQTFDLFFLFFICMFFVVFGLIIFAIVSSMKEAAQRQKQRETREKEVLRKQEMEPQVIASITQHDFNFSTQAFKNYVKEVFIRVQEGIESQELAMLRPIESDSLYLRHTQQINDLKNKGWTQHSDEQNIRTTQLIDYRQEAQFELVTVELSVSFLEYTTNRQGEVIRGSKLYPRTQCFHLVFKRDVASMTPIDQPLLTHQCPACQAPVSLNRAGVCEFCGHLVTSGKEGWILDEFSIQPSTTSLNPQPSYRSPSTYY